MSWYKNSATGARLASLSRDSFTLSDLLVTGSSLFIFLGSPFAPESVIVATADAVTVELSAGTLFDDRNPSITKIQRLCTDWLKEKGDDREKELMCERRNSNEESLSFQTSVRRGSPVRRHVNELLSAFERAKYLAGHKSKRGASDVQ